MTSPLITSSRLDASLRSSDLSYRLSSLLSLEGGVVMREELSVGWRVVVVMVVVVVGVGVMVEDEEEEEELGGGLIRD